MLRNTAPSSSARLRWWNGRNAPRVGPAPYTVPDDGPVGELLHATRRHPWRPSHLHFITTAPGYRTLVTEVFPGDDPDFNQDTVLGVRGQLVVVCREQRNRAAIPATLASREQVTDPYFTVDFDFVLAPQ